MTDNIEKTTSAKKRIKLRSVDIGGELHVPLHGRFYPDKPDTVGNITANGQTVSINVANITGLVIALRGVTAISGINCTFETSLDSTNGTDGTWFQMQGQRSNSMDVLEVTTGTLSATPTYVWNMPVSGVNWFRVRCTAFTSGTLEVRLSPCDDLMFPSRTAGVTSTGNVAHDGAVSGNPIRIGTKAVTAMPAVVSATNDVADSISTMQGVPIVTLDTVSAQRLRASLSLTTTSDTAIFAAQGTGLRSVLTDAQIINTGTAVDLIIKDGTTEIWRLTLPQNVPVMLAGLRTGIQSTANTALNAALSAAGTVRVNFQGYQGV